jgi:GTP-binding protein EngB required for normal cell division
MRDAVIGLVPVIDQALADCVNVVDQALLEPVALMRNRILARLDYPDDVLLTALAGGTGSGKSSLFNAIAGEEVAATGGVRPTTSQPKALVPAARASALAGYLDLIGIGDRVSHQGHDWLCLIDLPDTDSVEVDHRQRVDSLLPQLDCVVWVVDPEKYRDASLHHGYLAPMAAYGDQFVFVLNQCDRLGDAELSQVAADLSAVLLADGIENPTVITTAVQPQAGPVIGIEQLLNHLQGDLGGSVYEKALVDLRTAADSLLQMLGGGSGAEFDARWSEVVDEVTTQVGSGDISGASQHLVGFLDDLSAEVGGEIGDVIGELAGEAPRVILSAALDVTPSPPRQRWWRRSSREGGPQQNTVREALETRIADPTRGLLTRRAKAQASVTELALALNQLTPPPG